MRIINLVSGPRNISTALMYSFAQRPDTRVVDEPFYAVYLSSTGLNHPGREEVLRTQPTDEEEVRRQLKGMNDRPVLFVKNMAHHMEVMKHPFLENAVNLFLIRDPHLILTSYTRVIGQPVMRDIGLEYQYTLFRGLCENGYSPLVADAADILRAPEASLKKICDAADIPFHPSMLSWPAGPKPYDGVWAPYWYANVHRSSRFDTEVTARGPLPAHLEDLYQQASRYYEKLRAFSLGA